MIYRLVAKDTVEPGDEISGTFRAAEPEIEVSGVSLTTIRAGVLEVTVVLEDLHRASQTDLLGGRTTDDRSRGCNRLIKENVAAMVECAEDVIRHLNWKDDEFLMQKRSTKEISLTDRERQLLELMTIHNGLRPEELSIRSGIPIQNVLSLLTEMELKQWVHMEPGNFYQCMIVSF